jgi:PhnB protein
MTVDRPTLAPLLNVRRGKQALEFYQSAFGVTVTNSIESPDGEIVAELELGSSRFWIADESPAHKNFSPESLNGSTVRMVLVADDPDSVFDRAIKAGATSIYPPADQHYGWRVGRLADPFGHHWEIGKPLN